MLGLSNDLVNVGATTGVEMVSVAVPVLPVPRLVVVTAPVVLVKTVPLTEFEVTTTVMVQVPPAAIEPPVRLTLPLPAVAVSVPPHVFVAAGVAATVMPAGKVSLMARPAPAVPAVRLTILRVSTLVAPGAIVAGLNDFVTAGARSTVRLAGSSRLK